ncbi:ABC transporter ATP-binding protein [Piscinibacter defluvii]|uniref:ABC transporter ATP-binding protein n=1 Tax=Piscinibacter defluvii TaxID=1796922 RepID=UPI000FDD5D0F|nr:ABC transporter ATP-binding protein [Piscinibacter defluvii]
MSQPIVQLKGVQKTYDGEHLVVRDLNLDIAKGEFLTMLGPSGSGKTTTLMMLAGFETATHGEIFLDGKPINRLAPEARNIGMVFQSYALFPHMSVAENVAFPLTVRRTRKADIAARVERALGMVGLKGFGERRPAQLSGGQQQRVAVARALVFEPKLVLMDEPLSALDKQLREQMQYEIKQLHHRHGLTVVYVTHDQGEALTMSDRIAVFDAGVIQQLDTPGRLYEHPANAFVAGFIGENNKLAGTVQRRDGQWCDVRLADGSQVRAQAVEAGDTGAATLLSLRPERVLLNPAPGACDVLADAQVQDVTYLGDHLRLRVLAFGDQPIVMKLPNAARERAVAEGDAIRLGWRAQDCHALRAPA